MSVTEICARIEPSTYSTSEWTVDCGWTVIRTWSGVTSNSRQASMTSKPLFNMVAESTVMRRPMTQVGCLSARSGVMAANSSSGKCRNGPPEAVSQMVLTSAVGSDAEALMDGVVLAVDRQDRHVALAGGAGEDFAGGHHAFLVGQPDRLSGQDGRMRGLKARHADNSRDDEIRLRVGGAGNGSLRPMSDVDAGRAGFAKFCGETARPMLQLPST